MSTSKQAAPCLTTVAKKFFMGLSGIALVLFVIVHLLGNLTLYSPTSEAFNHYALGIHSFGKLLYAAEIGLLAVFLVHIFLGYAMKLKNKAARPDGYKLWKSKGGGTPSNISSRSMAITGSFILLFVLIHVKMFRFGPGMTDGYVTQVNGEQALDLYRVVHESFKNPLIVVFYVVAMVLLGLHLRHGFWSAFQSLGTTSGERSVKLRCLGAALALLMAVGFLFIPIYMYFFV